MAPPFFIDLGKAARDVLTQGYDTGLLKVDTTTRKAEIEFRTNVALITSTGKLSGGIDVKYKLPQYGTTLVERWNTNNVCTTEVTLEDKFFKGLRLILDSSYAPLSRKCSGRVRAKFKHDQVALCGELKTDSNGGPIFYSSAVLGHGPWYLGCSSCYDPSNSEFNHNSVAIAAEKSDFGFHSFLSNDKEFGANIYHKVRKDMELAVNLGWTSGESATKFGVAAKMDLDEQTVLRTKVDNTLQLAIALTKTITAGFKVRASVVVNLLNLNDGSQKVGLGLEYIPQF